MYNVLHIIPYKLNALIVEQNALHYFKYESRYSYGPMTTHWFDYNGVLNWLKSDLRASCLGEAKYHKISYFLEWGEVFYSPPRNVRWS
jgi:hypothetical protein